MLDVYTLNGPGRRRFDISPISAARALVYNPVSRVRAAASSPGMNRLFCDMKGATECAI